LVGTRSRAQRQSGFTLLELLVVFAIAALLVALARPMYTAAMPAASLRADVHDLAVTLRDARNRSISGSREIAVLFDIEAAQYRVADEAVVELSSGTEIVPMPLRSVGVGNFRRHSPAEQEFVVTFYPDGSSSGASIGIRNRGGAFRVDVDWLTGRVTAGKAENDDA